MIDTEALRKKVIDLAIQGKLTEQLPSDGDAETLYAQILDQKSQLIKEGKIKKDKELPGITADEIPFKVPENWKWVHMGDIFDHNTGKALNNSDKEGTKLEYITTSNMYWDHFELDGLKSMFFKESEIEKCTIRKGDLLICEGGDIGRSAIWNFDYEMRIQNHIHKLRGYAGIDHRFYFYLMRNYKDSGMIDGRGIGLQGFSSKRVHSLVVPLAPLAEQIRIADKLEEVLAQIDIIDNLQTKYSNDLAVLKNKIIDAGIRGKLTEQLPKDGTAEDLYVQIQEEKAKLVKEGKIKKEKPLSDITEDEIPFEIPKNWKWVRLSSISDSIWAGGDKPSDYTKERDVNHTVPVVANGVSDEGVLGYTSEANAKKNTLTVAGRGTIGYTVLRKYDYCPIVRLVVVEPSRYVEPSYLCYVLKALPAGSVGSSIPQLTVPMIRPKMIPLPPLSEQKRIVKKLEEVLESEVFICEQ